MESIVYMQCKLYIELWCVLLMLLFCCCSHRVRSSLSYMEQLQTAVSPSSPPFFKQFFFFLQSKWLFEKAENKSIPWRKAVTLQISLFFHLHARPPHWHASLHRRCPLAPRCHPLPSSPESRQVLVQSPAESLRTLTGAATVIIG